MSGEIRKELLEELARSVDGADRGDRSLLVRQAAERFGVSTSRLYRLLRGHRARPGDVRRPEQRKLDAGAAAEMARLLLKTKNKRGRVQMSTVDAIEIARLNGIIPADLEVSPDTVRRTLSDHRLDRRALEAPEPGITRRSLHPNHVHLVDFTPALQWYLKTDGSVGTLPPHMVPRKPDPKRAGKPHLWRYLLVDHCSGAFYVRYYYAPGENAADLMDFMWRSWTPKEHDAYPFHGVPLMVLADQGAPFKATGVRNLLKTLECDLELHGAGNAKASGSVEKAHHSWQVRFDSRLALQPARSLEELNERALEVCIACNAREPHTRTGDPRMATWTRIEDGQLRVPPAWEVFRRLATREPETRRVDNRLQIAWKTVQYQLEGPVVPQERVSVVEHPYADGELRVWTERGEDLVVTPLQRDEWGFLVGKRSVVIGSEDFTRHPDTPAQRMERAVEAAEEPLVADPWGDPLADLDLPYLAPRHGVPAIPEEQLPPVPPLGAVEVRERVVAALGRPLTVEEGDQVDELVGAGIPEEQVDQVVRALTGEPVEEEDQVQIA